MRLPPRIGLALASMLLVLLACDHSPTEPGGGGLGFQTVLKASLPGSPPDLAGREVVRDQAAWQAVWMDLHAVSAQPLPAVDFSREMVVVVLGPGCQGDTTISSIGRAGGELMVNAKTSSCNNTLCAIADFSLHVVRLPRFDGSVRFNVKGGSVLC
jgi:hypothetical protein